MEEAGDGKQLSHRSFLEQLCDKLAHPVALAVESKVTEREPKLTHGRMDSRPWEACTADDICAAPPLGASVARCSWCKFKSRIRAGMDAASTKADAEATWKKYCDNCKVPESTKPKAALSCNGCHHHFCGGACYREFHSPQSET